MYVLNLCSVLLVVLDYYFMIIDMLNLLCWLVSELCVSGVVLCLGQLFIYVWCEGVGWQVEGVGCVCYLVGVDGVILCVVDWIGLGWVWDYFYGVEQEFVGVVLFEVGVFYCFVSWWFVLGYIGWVVQNLIGVQVGLVLCYDFVCVWQLDREGFLVYVCDVVGLFVFVQVGVICVGLVLCGLLDGLIIVFGVILIGDVVGIVLLLLVGGIYFLWWYGWIVGDVIVLYLCGQGLVLEGVVVGVVLRFWVKWVLCWVMDYLQMDWLLDLVLQLGVMWWVVEQIYFY